MRRVIAIIGGALAALVAAAAMLWPAAGLESAVAASGLPALVPQAAPPLGVTARVALALAGLAAMLALTAFVAWLARPRRAAIDRDEALTAPARADREVEAPMRELRLSEQERIDAAPLVEAPAHRQSDRAPRHDDRPREEKRIETAPAPVVEAPAAPPRVERSAAPLPVERSPAPRDLNGDADLRQSLQRIEAVLAAPAARDPGADLARRFDALEERVGGQVAQIAQQLAEIAALSRAAARTPAAAAPLDAVRIGAPPRPADPRARAGLAQAARALRASLGDPADA